ncbi:MAG: CpsB/CapC family capsule biosynthesis tyrosine phosphatase [Gemmatimonadaceae bacterium]
MIDLHTHILPGVDDGSRSLDNSLRVLERLAAEGVTAVACTPHLDASQADSAPLEEHGRLMEELRSGAPAGITLHSGFEVMLDRPGCDLRLPGLTLGSSHAVLVELPRSSLPEGADHELLRIRASGLIPVVAHPERYRGVTVDLMHRWREVGAILQGDALMLLSSGPMARLARAMLEEGVYDILASDNHGDRRSLTTVRSWLREMGGDEQGKLLTEENPRRVLANEPMLPVPRLGRRGGLWQRVRELFARR